MESRPNGGSWHGGLPLPDWRWHRRAAAERAETLLLFSVCSARFCHCQPSATLLVCAATLSIIHRPAAPCKQRRGRTSAAVSTQHLSVVVFSTDSMFYLETNKFRLQAGKYWEISKSRPVTHHCYALSVKYVFCNYKHIMCLASGTRWRTPTQ